MLLSISSVISMLTLGGLVMVGNLQKKKILTLISYHGVLSTEAEELMNFEWIQNW